MSGPEFPLHLYVANAAQEPPICAGAARCLRLGHLPFLSHVGYLHPYLSTLSTAFTLTHPPGSFVYLYKLLLNALPMLFPPPSPAQSPSSTGLTTSLPVPSSGTSPALAASTSYHALAASSAAADERRRSKPRLALSERAQRMLVRKKTRRWHAVAAGALASGIAVMFEKQERRATIGQQMFVRYVYSSLIHSADIRMVLTLRLVDCRGRGTRIARRGGFTFRTGQ